MQRTYTLSESVMAVTDGKQPRLLQLEKDSTVLCIDDSPDQNGMVDAVCSGRHFLLFLRDLKERSKPLQRAV